MAFAMRVFRYVSAGAIGFFFLVTVMIATAQQDVITRMKSEGLSVGYSSALALRQQVKDKVAKAPGHAQSVLKLSSDLNSTQAKVDQSQQDFDMAWEAFKPSVNRLNRARLCDLSQPSTDTPATRAGIANEVRQCQLDAGTTPNAQRTLTAAQGEAEHFSKSSQAYYDAMAQLSSTKRMLEYAKAQLAADQTLTDNEAKAERSFGDMDVLLQRWLLFGPALVKFPPPLLGDLNPTFVSGLFGALLLTLILIVYPSNKISNANKARSGARTFLGGCIALCVYVVILSGTAVLGSGNTSSGAGTNYMAFCGIGIIAGMFSDRVAGWLSKQADTFFK